MNGREQLRQIIGDERGARAEFARKAKISLPHLMLYLDGKRGLSISMAKRVCAAADDRIPLRDLLPADVAELLGAA